MAYKNIDVARCSMEELKKEIRKIHEFRSQAGTPKNAAELQNFVVEANKRLQDEIAELKELRKHIAIEVLGVTLPEDKI